MIDALEVSKLSQLVLRGVGSMAPLSHLNGPTLAAVLHTAATTVEEATNAQTKIEVVSSLLSDLNSI